MEEKITKKVMEDYEVLRRSGATNMFDLTAVVKYSKKFGLQALLPVAQDKKLYAELIKNYSFYIKKYEVQK